MSNCVNKSSKEFKDCCKRLNVSPTTLEPIIHEFINIEGNENSFPSDVYIEERIHGKSMEVLEDAQVQLWENRYSQPRVFNTQEEALTYYNECNKYFPKESVGLKETLEGKYEVVIKKPVVVSQNYLETKFQEEETTKLLETFFFNKKEETAAKEEIKQEQSNQKVIKGELGVNKKQLISLLGSTMYQSGRQEVAIKEILQNAFDAVKIAKSKGQIEDGKIDIELDTTKRTIKIQDNGIGMTPQIVQKAFFTIGGSYKGDNVDNSLKSGGLGLAKMAFLFGSEYVEVTTIKDGIKTYVRANPEEIQNDNFNIVTSKTTESNGTTVEVKIPENYLDNNGELKNIYFSYMPSFLDKPMIGDVTVNTRIITGWSDTTTSSDKSQIPEGYFSIGKATADFGNVEIYIKPKKTSSQYVRFAVLNSGLYQFNNSFKLNQEAQFEVIFNILPKVGVENALYPINNQREGFRSTVDAEINDLAFLLDKINNVLVRQSVASAFENAISINVKSVAKVTREKAGFEESLKSIRKELETSFKATTSTSNSKSSASPKSAQNVEISLSEVRENKEKEEQEKKRTSSLDTSDIKINEQQIKVNTISLDITKPVFHNNTTLVIEQDGQIFLEELGALLLELKDLYSQTYKDANIKTRHASKQIVEFISQQYWGISFDKNYGGVNVNPSLFNFLGINPFYYVTQYEGVDTALMLTEYITHLIKHEFNHNYASGEGAEFTGRFPATDAEFAGIGPKFLKDWKNKLYTLIKTNLKTVVKYADEYQKATNLGDGFKENKLTTSNESSNSSIINDVTDIQGDTSRENVQNNGGEFDAIIQEFIEEQVRKDKEWKEVQQRDAIEEEKQQIKQKAIADGTFMKAPNGNPTNLTEDQWLSVRTKAFKEWFGDWENTPENASKVVDENGEPLVVYHHTDNPNLTKFSIDFDNYFYKDGGTKSAIFFDEEKTGTLNRKYDIPVFLNIRNLNEYNETKAQLHERGTTYREIVNQSAKVNPINGGVHMKDFDDNMKEHQSIWIVHNPNQIKSAKFNIGYSKEDDNIYHENEWGVDSSARRDNRLEELRKQDSIGVVDLLNLIDSNSEYSSIIELLKTKKQKGKPALLTDIKVKVVSSIITPNSSDVKKLEISRGVYRRAYYDAATKELIIDSDGRYNEGRADSVILHEIIHHITVNRIKSNTKFREEFDAIIDKYIEAFPHSSSKYKKDRNNHYIEEFIADIWSDKHTIERLKSTKSDKKLTLWDRIKNFFVKIFSGSEGTLMADASDALYRLLDELETDTSKDTFYEGENISSKGSSRFNLTSDTKLQEYQQSSEFYSGAADGADQAWAKYLREKGLKVKDFTVKDYDALPQSEKDRIEKDYQNIVQYLGRKAFPASDYRGKLVRRDMLQAEAADAVFAIGTFDSKGWVSGGTAYAVTRAVGEKKVYFYDLNSLQWYIYEDQAGAFWPLNDIPTLTPHAAVIGTRDDVKITHVSKGPERLRKEGHDAIKAVIEKTFNENTETSEENLTQDEIDAKTNKEAELDAIFQNTLQLTEQLKNIQDSGLISTSEFTQLANDVAYYISDLITSWQENPEEFKQSAPTLAAEIDVRTLSRRELVEKIGVPKLLEVVKKTLFGKRIPGVDARKTLLLFKNFDALIRFGSSAFNTVEDFQISYSEIGYSVSDKTESTENENLSNEENAVIEENGDKQEHWQIDSRTVDTFLTMSQAVKKELARCYKLNADGSIKQNEFGINERMSPRDATSCILRWAQGSLTLSDMITKLEGKQENNPWIKPIIEKLRDNSGKYSDFQSQFFGVFCKHFQEYYIVKEFNEKGNRVLRIMPVNRTPALNEIMTSIEVLFKLKAHPMFDNKGLIKEKLDLLKSYVDLLNEISQGEFDTLPLDRISKDIAKIADLLGYKTTDEMVILALTPESLYNIKKALSYIVSNLEKGLGDSNYNPFSFNKENKNGIRNNLKNFLQPLTEVLEDLAISSFFESGKMYQSYVIPSYMTKLMRKFQNSNEQEFKEFMQREYGQYEWFRDQSRDIEDSNSWKNDWLRQLYFMSNENRRKLFGHKVQLSFVGHNYMRNMTGPEYVMAIMTEFFSGSKDSKETIVPTWYKIPMLSNKPSLEFVKFARYRGIGYEEIILDGLQQVFTQELGRIIEVKNRAYSTKDDKHIKNFDTNGQKFCFLDFLNDYLGSKAHAELGILLNKKIDSSEKLTIEEENKLFDLVRKEIDSFMTKKSNEIIQSYKNSGLFEAVKKIDGIGNTDAEIESNLKNFIWNDAYASMMILQMTITDIAYYANAEDLQKRLAQIHAPGIRPNIEAMDYGEYDEVGKLIRKAQRVCDGNLRAIFLKDFEGDAVVQNVIENLEVVFSRKENEAKTDAEKEYWETTKEVIIDAFKDVNVTDAQAYNSITSYRKKAIMFGKWSPKNEEIYKKLKNKEWNISDLETIFQPLKPFVYTSSTKTSVGSKIKVGMQFKNAEYALLIADAILRNEDTGKPNLLKVLSEVMEESADRTENKDKGIDTIMFASAVKAGLHGRLDIANFASEEAAKEYVKTKIYDVNGVDGYNETYVHTFPAEDYSIQQDYSPHFLDHSQADGSQKRMIIPSDLDPNAEYQVNGIEKPFTAEEFRKEYEKIYAENIESSLNELEVELGLNLPTKKLRNIALSQVLQKEILSSPRYGIDLYIACSVDKDGNFNIPLGDPIQSKRIEQLINSIVKNRLNKQKIKGGPVIQVSNFGSTRLNIRFKDKDGNILPTLTEWLDQNPGKTKEDFKKELENTQASVAYYECYAPAYMQEMFEDFMDERGFIDWEAISELEPEMLEMIGFRIPTEDLYSIAPMKIMGFLPKEAGEVIMMPYEVTVVWGSDKHHCFYPTK